MKEVKFTVPGEPRGKGRPRFSTHKKGDGRTFVTARTPDETIIYENLVRMEYERQCGGVYFGKGEPVELTVTAYLPIPISTSKKRARLMDGGELRPVKKPDLDNMVKTAMDAVNRIAYSDDVQVVDMHVHKYYSERPRLEVTIREARKGADDAQ